MRFTKWQGCGNDFIVLDFLNKSDIDFSSLAKKLCDRHYGIGADGVLIIANSTVADFRMRLFNADGSEAEMCGNGIRCVARHLYDEKTTDQLEFTIETGAGVLVPHLLVDQSHVSGVRVDMGQPHLAPKEIPVQGYAGDMVVNQQITVKDTSYQMTCVSMGNPHAVVFVKDADSFPLEDIGPAFEHHSAFPARTNTEFVTVLDPAHVRMRVWERGAGVTLACGTGACATVVAGVLTKQLDRKVEVRLDGGNLTIEWAQNNHIFMTGPAEFVFSGEILND